MYQCTTSWSVPNKHSNNEKQWCPQLTCLLVAFFFKKRARSMGNKHQISCKPGTSWLTVHLLDLIYLCCIYSNRSSYCISPAFHFMPFCKVWLYPQEAQVLAGRERNINCWEIQRTDCSNQTIDKGGFLVVASTPNSEHIMFECMYIGFYEFYHHTVCGVLSGDLSETE